MVFPPHEDEREHDRPKLPNMVGVIVGIAEWEECTVCHATEKRMLKTKGASPT
jgi:hypothetical protein